MTSARSVRHCRALARRDTDAVLLTEGPDREARRHAGGGRAAADVALPGFGERWAASWPRWARGLAVAAGAGVAKGRLVVYLPGSSGAVRDGLEQLVIPELVHAVRLLGRL
jgi:molybdenum cofactor biosynthesis protein B